MFRRISFLFLIFSIAACAPSGRKADQATSADKRVPGQATTNGGAGEYAIPIDISGGDASYRPAVSLHYSSRSGNGLAGMGWYVGAGGAVHRCPFIVDGDGLDRPVQYAPDDRLCINGTKMQLIKGKYGKDGSVYEPEINANVAVRLVGDLNSPKSAFLSFDNDGNIDVYQAAVVQHGVSAPLSWLLNRSISKSGSAFEFRYDDLGYGEVLLDEITYNGKYSEKDSTLTHGDRFVRFGYSHRDDNASSFLAGGEWRSTVRLTTISVGAFTATGETVLREYGFTYRPSQGSGRSLLASAQVCKDLAAQTDCSLPTKFSWRDAPLAFSNPQPIAARPSGKDLASAWQPGDSIPSLTSFSAGGDYNGDGRRDLFVRSTDGQVDVFVLQPGGKVLKQIDVSHLMTVSHAYPPGNGRSLTQVGSANIIGGVNGKIAVLDWSGDDFAPPAQTSIPNPDDTALLNATGDGQTDLVVGRHVASEYVVTLYRNEGSSDKRLALSAGEVVARIQNAPELHLDPQPGISGSGRTLVVRNGDRPIRIIEFVSETDGHLKVTSLSLADVGVTSEAMTGGFVFADINGDGLDDIVYTAPSGDWTIQMNDGLRYAAPIDTHEKDIRTPVGRAGTLVTDVDSDGRADLVFPSRRLVDFCIETSGKQTVCADSLAQTNPHMDLGIYEYDVVDFQLDGAGNYAPHVRRQLNLIGQANRAHPADIFGDGYTYLISPFDRGVANGWFKSADGNLVECPPNFGCGVKIAQRAHIQRDDRSDAALDLLVGVESSPGHSATWTYYPISNPFRNLYSVPPLGSPERFIDTRRYYFTSSMYVVGEMDYHDGPRTEELRYDYGAGEYNTAGRGFDGFKWIVVHDASAKKKFGSWFGQDGPYRGILERNWSEDESDDENDYFHGSPGKRYLTFERTSLGCTGPSDNAVSRRYHCDPSDAPGFSVYKKQ